MVALLLVSAIRLEAQTPEEKGFWIAKQAELRDEGFEDFNANIEMILKNSHGQESRRSMRILTQETENDGDKSISIFDNPRDVKGTALLTYSHKVGDDDQWLYLPALKRVKRISSSNKSGSFMGSEFAYEDVASEEIEKYTYKWIRDEVYNGQDCFVIERYPVDKKSSGYTRQVVWLDKAGFRKYKTNYFDRKNTLLKTYTTGEFQQYLDRYWRTNDMYMVNHQNGKATRLLWSDYKFRTGLDGQKFTKSSLKRVR